MTERYDVIVVGGGHNGLVAAAYAALAGRRVLLLERAAAVGGAAVSERPFAGVDARLSRYSYLVSLLPDRIVSDLALPIRLESRPVASYSPYRGPGGADGLLVEREPSTATRASFARLTGSDREFDRWQEFSHRLSEVARLLAPTMLEPLRPADEIRSMIGPSAWDDFVARPLGEVIEGGFTNDLVRGVVLTDGVIGTFATAHDASLAQNRCFLYHVIGNGTGEWRVPVGGMGAVTKALNDAAVRAGVTIRTGAEVRRIWADGAEAEVAYTADEHGESLVAGRAVLAGVAPTTLSRLLGEQPAMAPEGSQLKLNLLLTRLPRLASGFPAEQAFAGTFHIREGYDQLERAAAEASSGQLPSDAPAEVYCHTLTDDSILGPNLSAAGWHTLTLFGLHTPARLFAGETNAERTRQAVASYLAGLNEVLAEPIEDCLATDANGDPCLEAKSPPDIEAAVGMPGGHIFHGDLSWPWAEDEHQVGDWGVETSIPNVLLCGSGARRAGGVSGIGGQNAAAALIRLLG